MSLHLNLLRLLLRHLLRHLLRRNLLLYLLLQQTRYVTATSQRRGWRSCHRALRSHLRRTAQVGRSRRPRIGRSVANLWLH